MRAMPFDGANVNFRLDGAGPERGVPAKVGEHAGPDGILSPTDPSAAMPYALTRWMPDSSERACLAAGGDIELVVFGGGFPPVSIGVAPSEDQGLFVWASIPPPVARDLVTLIRRQREGPASAEHNGQAAGERLQLEGLQLLADSLDRALRALPQPPPPPPRKR